MINKIAAIAKTCTTLNEFIDKINEYNSNLYVVEYGAYVIYFAENGKEYVYNTYNLIENFD